MKLYSGQLDNKNNSNSLNPYKNATSSSFARENEYDNIIAPNVMSIIVITNKRYGDNTKETKGPEWG